MPRDKKKNAQQRTYQRDKNGAKEYSRGSLQTDRDGRTYHVDRYGAREHSKGHYETDRSGRTVHVDRYGAKEYSKGGFQTDEDGVTVRVVAYGNKRWSEGGYVTEKSRGASKRGENGSSTGTPSRPLATHSCPCGLQKAEDGKAPNRCLTSELSGAPRRR